MRESGRVTLDGLEREVVRENQIEYLLEGGIHVLACLGTDPLPPHKAVILHEAMEVAGLCGESSNGFGSEFDLFRVSLGEKIMFVNKEEHW